MSGNFNQDPWSVGYQDGYSGSGYDNGYSGDDYDDYDSGFDAGRAARSEANN